MTKRAEPRRAVIGGDEVVLLDPEVYEQLAASRRQAGARDAQLNTLRQRLRSTAELLDRIAAVAATLPDCPELTELLATRHAALDGRRPR